MFTEEEKNLASEMHEAYWGVRVSSREMDVGSITAWMDVRDVVLSGGDQVTYRDAKLNQVTYRDAKLINLIADVIRFHSRGRRRRCVCGFKLGYVDIDQHRAAKILDVIRRSVEKEWNELSR